jgi:hypothetical protein
MKIVGITGMAGSGKDTLGDILGGEHLSFAEPLKRVCSYVFDIPYDELNTQEGKARVHENGFGFTNRRILQLVGTDAFRNLVDSEVWVAKFRREAEEFEYVVVTDLRFDNEAEIIKSMGGVIISITRDNNPIEVEDHSSEVGVSDDLIDLVIENNGSIKDLELRLKSI